MSDLCFLHRWQSHATNPRFDILAGHTNACVRVKATPAGYFWSYGKRYGHAMTLEEARNWVEALAEHYSIPKAQRWLEL